MGTRGGRRAGAGRKKGSLNKTTIARMSAAELLGVSDADLLDEAIHRRGHALLLQMERLALDPMQPSGVRIMAARTALPFLLPRPETEENLSQSRSADLVAALIAGREGLRENRAR